jgi:hypothetical protein
MVQHPPNVSLSHLLAARIFSRSSPPSSRNLGQIIWIHVPSDRAPKTPAPAPGSTAPAAAAPPFNAKEAHLRAVIEKKSMINLVCLKVVGRILREVAYGL